MTHKVVCSLFQFLSYSSANIALLIIHILSRHTRMLSTQNLAIRNRRVDEVPPEAGDFARIINGSLLTLKTVNVGRLPWWITAAAAAASDGGIGWRRKKQRQQQQ